MDANNFGKSPSTAIRSDLESKPVVADSKPPEMDSKLVVGNGDRPAQQQLGRDDLRQSQVRTLLKAPHQLPNHYRRQHRPTLGLKEIK